MAQPKPAAKKAAPQMKNFNGVLLFDKTNYMIMAIGVAVVALGFLLMSGGKSPNPNEFHPETLYSAQRIVIAPITILIGFGIEFYAILKKPKTVE